MPVPSTVDSVRQQIVEAVKLSLDTTCTILPINGNYGQYSISTDYPLAKVWMGNSLEQMLKIRSLAIRSDELHIVIVPYCVESDFELKTSKVIETYTPLFNAQAIKSLMYSTYQNQFSDLIFNRAEVLQTDIQNPYAYVHFVFTAKYQIGA